MWHIIINGEKLINFVDIYYYGGKLNNYCGDKLIYCLLMLMASLWTLLDHRYTKMALGEGEKFNGKV